MSIRFVKATPDVMSLSEFTALTQNVGELTASFWVILNSTGVTQQIFFIEGNTGNNSRFEMQFTSLEKVQVFARAPDASAPTPSNVISTGAVSWGAIAHVVVVVSVVNDTVSIYINGVLDAASPQSMVFANATTDNTTCGDLVGFGGNEGGSQPCGADVWDLCFWHRALNAAEVSAIFHSGGSVIPEDSLVGRMRCREDKSGVAVGATALKDTSATRYLGDSIAVNSGAPTYQQDYAVDSMQGAG